MVHLTADDINDRCDGPLERCNVEELRAETRRAHGVRVRTGMATQLALSEACSIRVPQDNISC